MEDNEKELTKLEKAFVRDGEEDYVRGLRTASFEQLEAKLNELSKHRESIADTKKRDRELNEAKALKSRLEAPYREQLSGNKKRSRLVYLIMQEEFPLQMEAYGSSDE